MYSVLLLLLSPFSLFLRLAVVAVFNIELFVLIFLIARLIWRSSNKLYSVVHFKR